METLQGATYTWCSCSACIEWYTAAIRSNEELWGPLFSQDFPVHEHKQLQRYNPYQLLFISRGLVTGQSDHVECTVQDRRLHDALPYLM